MKKITIPAAALIFILFILYTYKYKIPDYRPGRIGYVDFCTIYEAIDYFWMSPEKLYGKIPYNGGFTYPPVVTLLYSGFKYCTGNYYQAKQVWIIINYLAVLFILWLVYRTYNWQWNLGFLIIVLATLSFKPLHDNLKWGNIKIILLALYMLFINLYRKKKEVRAGLVLGITIMVSLQPIILLIYFFFRKKWRIIISALSVFILSLLLTISIIGYGQHYKYFTVVLPSLFISGASAAPFIQSIDAMTRRLFLANNEYTVYFFNNPFIAFKLPAILKLILLSGLIVFLYKTRNKQDTGLVWFTTVFIFMVLIHTINWEYHYTILLIVFYNYSGMRKTVFNYRWEQILFYLIFIGLLLPLPYDNQLFTKNLLLVIFTNTKIILLALWFGLSFYLAIKNSS